MMTNLDKIDSMEESFKFCCDRFVSEVEFLRYNGIASGILVQSLSTVLTGFLMSAPKEARSILLEDVKKNIERIEDIDD